MGIATAFYRLGAKGLWGDEVWTVSWKFPTVFFAVRAPTDFPLNWLLTTAASLVSNSEFLLRLPEALMGVATVVALFFIGKRAFGTLTGVFGALLLALAPYHVWVSQDARPYAGLAFYSLISLACFQALLARPSWRAGVGFAVVVLLNLSNHFFALAPVAVELAAVMVWAAVRLRRGAAAASGGVERKRTLFTAAWVLGGAAVAILLTSPLLVGAALYSIQPGEGGGKIESATSLLSPAFLEEMLAKFGSGFGWPLWLTLALFAIGCIQAARARKGFILLCLAWLALPIAALGLLKAYHTIDVRYMIFLQPVYLIVVAYGAVQLGLLLARGLAALIPAARARQRQAAALTLTLIVLPLAAITFTPTWGAYWLEKINDWSAVCSYLHHNAVSGDTITGNSYFMGIMNWCYYHQDKVMVRDTDINSLSQLVSQGANIWYIDVDPSSPTHKYVRDSFAPVPRSAWAKPDLVTVFPDAERITFPQGELPVTLYHYIPSSIQFHQVVTGDANMPDYAQMGPGERLTVRLMVLRKPPRALAVTYFDLQGRDLNVYADGALVAAIKAGASGGKWIERDIPLPDTAGDVITVEFENPGTYISAVSKVEIISGQK